MNYFDEKNEFDNLDKKIFDDNYKKQIKYTKKKPSCKWFPL